MALLKYTTDIPQNKSVAEIIAMLACSKAQSIMQKFDGAGNVVAIEFSILTTYGQMYFQLPADPAPTIATLKRQAMAGQIPKRFINDVPQARRVAWRIVRQWVEAQLAIIELGMVKVEQVFLPYALDPSTGKTLFQSMTDQKFERLALPAPKAA